MKASAIQVTVPTFQPVEVHVVLQSQEELDAFFNVFAHARVARSPLNIVTITYDTGRLVGDPVLYRRLMNAMYTAMVPLVKP